MSPPPFCIGGSTMSHQGFTIPGKPNEECVLFLFPGWILNTPVKYAFATIGTFAMAFLVEYLVYARRKYLTGNKLSHTKQALRVTAYLAQTLFSFFCMLLTMTFSTFIFIAVILGFALGKILLNSEIEGLASDCCLGSPINGDGNMKQISSSPPQQQQQPIKKQEMTLV
jgi:hypothetical protein